MTSPSGLLAKGRTPAPLYQHGCADEATGRGGLAAFTFSVTEAPAPSPQPFMLKPPPAGCPGTMRDRVDVHGATPGASDEAEWSAQQRSSA